MKAKDTLLLNNTITQNPNLGRRAWFWHVASHITNMYITLGLDKVHHAGSLYSEHVAEIVSATKRQIP